LVVAVAMSNRCPIALSVATGVTAGRLVIPSLGTALSQVRRDGALLPLVSC